MAGGGAALLAVALTWGTTSAAFTATTTNNTNAWATGTVTFGTSAPATALFTVTGAVPGSLGTQCVDVSYTGTVAATVKLYAATSGTLAPHLTLQVNQDAVAGHTCASPLTGFTNLYNPKDSYGQLSTALTVSTFATSYATSTFAWTAAPGTSRPYQFVWQLQDDNTDVSKTASVTFTWEAHSN